MPKWAIIAMRTVGVLNCVLGIYGSYLLFRMARWTLTKHDLISTPAYPYINIAFWTLTGINAVFLVILLTTAVRLIQLKTSAIVSYSIAVAGLVAYGFLNGAMWGAGHGIGISVGAVTGIGNMGIATFEFAAVVPDLYPIASAILLLVIRRQVAKRSLADH